MQKIILFLSFTAALAQSVCGQSLVGKWASTATFLKSAYNPNGTYAGDASRSYNEQYEFNADGRYRLVYLMYQIGTHKTYYTETRGKYTLEGRQLTLIPDYFKAGIEPNITEQPDHIGKPKTFSWFIGTDKHNTIPALHLHHDGDFYADKSFPWEVLKPINSKQ